MRDLLEKVEKELDKIGDKGLTSSNLDTTYKLIDIYKDIKEADYYKKMCEEGEDSYGARARDSRGRYMRPYNDHDNEDDYDARGGRGGRGGYNERGGNRYSHYYPWDDRTERYFERIGKGIDDYNEGRDRYRDGDAQDREQMIKGIEMAMSALVSFVETLYDHAETAREKDVIKEHIDKLKKL